MKSKDQSFFTNAVAEELHDTNITVTALLPGAAETEFAKTSGMDKTDLFNKTVRARSVALGGYNCMLKGKPEVISELAEMQKMMVSTTGIMPKQMLLTQIRKMQEIN